MSKKQYSKASWPDVKRAYLNGEGSIRQLAERFNVCLSTIGKRCKREGWAREKRRREALAAAGLREALDQNAKQEGRDAAMTALGFLARSVREAEVWLNRISALADSGELDADKLKTLLESWRMVISEARRTFGLDGMTTTGRPSVALAISGENVHVHPAQRLAVPIRVVTKEPPALPPADGTTEQSPDKTAVARQLEPGL